jgi:hypothetical protein
MNWTDAWAKTVWPFLGPRAREVFELEYLCCVFISQVVSLTDQITADQLKFTITLKDLRELSVASFYLRREILIWTD